MQPKYDRQSCPNCGHRVGWRRIHIRAWIWAKWKCEACNKELRFDPNSRYLGALLLVPAIFVFIHVIEAGVSWWAISCLVVLVFLAHGRLEKIVLVAVRPEPLSTERLSDDLGTRQPE